MDKENLAYKLTADIFKYYKIEELEKKYSLSGGKLISAIYNEIVNSLNVSNDNTHTVIFTGENEIPD